MEEFFLVMIWLIVLGILTLAIISMVKVNNQLSKILKNITDLRNEFYKRETVAPVVKQEVTPVKETERVVEKTEVKIETPVSRIEEPPIKPEVPIPAVTIDEKEEPVYSKPIAEAVIPPVRPIVQKQPKPVKPKTDLEKWIGEHLIAIIGIGVLVLGLVFFVKYAIDKNWINEIGRVAIGILSGGALIALAHKLRKTYRTFSAILVGGGIAVLYFTITIAFQNYHLFSQTAAFIIMVVITSFAVLLSIAYDRQILAILAIVGGFGTPFFVSTGDGNYIVLFSYMMILNVGMLVLSYMKKWYWVNVICFAFTVLIFSGWLSYQIVNKPNPPYLGAMIFASLFYVTFFLMNIINNIREKRKFNWSEITILLTNTFVFFVAGMVILDHVMNAKLQGLFTISIAVFNFIFAFMLYKRKQVDRNLIYLLIGFVLTFLSLTAPIQLDGNYITLFWAAETVALLWFSQKSGIIIIKLASVVLVPLMLISLIIDWTQLYVYYDMSLTQADADFLGIQLPESLPVIFNKAFISSIAVVISLFLNMYLLKFEPASPKYIETGSKVYRWFLLPLCIIFMHLGFFLELQYQLWSHIDMKPIRQVYLGLYNFSFVFGLMFWSHLRKIKVIKEISMGIGLFTLFLYMTLYHRQVAMVRDAYVSEGTVSLMHYMFHYISVVLALGIAYWLYKMNLKPNGERSVLSTIALWFGMLVFVFVGSTELDHLAVLTQVDMNNTIYDTLLQSRKISYPIFWGLTSFTLMFLGMRFKNKTLRIISLSLFALTLLKLFFWDIRGINEGGKIVAFISLGILLLIVSFMYQKLKRLILEDDNKANEQKSTE